jgi:hypothetical protein
MWAFVAVLPFVGLSVIAAMFLGNVWIGKAVVYGKDGGVKTMEQKGMVMTSPYLLGLFSGNIDKHRTEVVPIENETTIEMEKLGGGRKDLETGMH